jgi:hypothetical protein
MEIIGAELRDDPEPVGEDVVPDDLAIAERSQLMAWPVNGRPVGGTPKRRPR